MDGSSFAKGLGDAIAGAIIMAFVIGGGVALGLYFLIRFWYTTSQFIGGKAHA